MCPRYTMLLIFHLVHSGLLQCRRLCCVRSRLIPHKLARVGRFISLLGGAAHDRGPRAS